MDRLTKRMGGISYSLCDNVIIAKCENCNHRMPSCYDEDCQAELDVTTRLAAYEDTGLTPEDVARMRWIPVSERLPEGTGHYLVISKMNWAHGGNWEDNSGDIRRNMAIAFFERVVKFNIPYVTHWMPLPQPPKEEK